MERGKESDNRAWMGVGRDEAVAVICIWRFLLWAESLLAFRRFIENCSEAWRKEEVGVDRKSWLRILILSDVSLYPAIYLLYLRWIW